MKNIYVFVHLDSCYTSLMLKPTKSQKFQNNYYLVVSTYNIKVSFIKSDFSVFFSVLEYPKEDPCRYVQYHMCL